MCFAVGAGQQQVAMLSYLLAVLAACANATSSVLQRRANREVPQKQNLSLRLIGSLLHPPIWFGGIWLSPSASCSRPPPWAPASWPRWSRSSSWSWPSH